MVDKLILFHFMKYRQIGLHHRSQELPWQVLQEHFSIISQIWLIKLKLATEVVVTSILRNICFKAELHQVSHGHPWQVHRGNFSKMSLICPINLNIIIRKRNNVSTTGVGSILVHQVHSNTHYKTSFIGVWLKCSPACCSYNQIAIITLLIAQ